MARLREDIALLEHKAAEEARQAEEERIAKEAEEAHLAKIEEEKRAAEEERKRREEEERRQAEEQRQVAITLAEYQKNTEKAEVDKIEAVRTEFKKREDVDVKLRKATAKVQREAKAKARKEAAAAAKKSGSEKVEGSGKRGCKEREISVTIRSFLTEHRVKWMVKEGVVCESCEKKEKKSFWRMEARWGKACLACHNLKKSCSAGRAEESEAEAGPSKRRKVEGKGKGKAATPNSGVAESAATDVLRDILKEL